ncbi:lipopolysaccharide biosynthesis protein [Rhizorhapis sp. SPR117]|uniref:lipopolysaccharide biosynthesis protein n=1 Tax=Rhizorhapis sp. SPR117 TaxID=2912611 RepID=UPI001F4611CE|nr:lipopolysaccharide biosynthesis protein [Rhizorhapis sp. SPR117]
MHGDTSIGRILQNTVWLLTGKGVGAVLSLFYLAIVTRTLGPSGFGQFALILSTAQAIGIIVSFETWQIIVKFGQEHVQSGDSGRFGRLLTFCIAIDLCGALVGCLIAAAAVFLLSPYFDWSRETGLQIIAFCAIMLITIRSTPMGILRLFDRFDAGALAETMVPVGRMIGAVIAWLVQPDVTAFLIAWACAELLCATTYWTLALMTARRRMGRWNGRRFLSTPRENTGILGFLAATNVSTSVSGLTRQLSVLLVGFFTGAAGAGLYRLAYQLSASLAKISGLLSRTIFAELAKVHVSQSGKDLRKLFRRTNRLAIIAGGVIIALILLLGKPLLLLMAGPEFLGAYPLLLLLGIAASIDLVGVSYEPLLMATNHARVSVAIKLVNAVLLLGLLAALLPNFGPVGAALATVAVSVVGFLFMGAFARKYAGQVREAD